MPGTSVGVTVPVSGAKTSAVGDPDAVVRKFTSAAVNID